MFGGVPEAARINCRAACEGGPFWWRGWLETFEIAVERDDRFRVGAGEGEGRFFEAVVARRDRGEGVAGADGRGLGTVDRGVGDGEEVAEIVDDLVDAAGVGAEFHAGGGGLLGGGGELLGDLFHAGDGAGDLFDAAGLLFAAAVDLFDEGFDLVGGAGDAVDGGGDFVEFLFAFGGAGDGLFDELRCVFSGLGGALGEVADFVGDDGEAHAGLTGAGGLDGGVQGENIGLEGDVVDDLDDLGDTAGGAADFVHGLHHLVQGEVGLIDDAAGFLGALGGGAGVFGVAGGHGVDLFGGGGGLFERGGLFTGGLGDRLAGGGDLTGGAGELLGVEREFVDALQQDAGDGALVVEHAAADGDTDEAEDGKDEKDGSAGAFGVGAEFGEDSFFVLDELAGGPVHFAEAREEGAVQFTECLVHFLGLELFDDLLVLRAEGIELGAEDAFGVAGLIFLKTRALEFGEQVIGGLLRGGEVAAGLFGNGGLLQHGGHGQLAFQVFQAFGGRGDPAGEHLVTRAAVDGGSQPGTQMVGDP